MKQEDYPQGPAPRAGKRGCLLLLGALALFGALPGLHAGITITEINYQPPSGNPDLEFIEIHNNDPLILDISGYTFTKGVQFSFPEGTFLEGGAYLVVCASESAVRARYGITNTLGNFVGRLDNAGEEIALNITGGGVEARVEYKTGGKWPIAPAGTGHTLSIQNVYLDPEEPESWTSSLEMGGTPGRANFPTQAPDNDTVIIPDDEVWKYAKGTAPFSTPETAWRLAGFNDSGWGSGQTGIGYGDSDDRTELLDMQNGYVAFAARKVFNLTAGQIASFDQMALLLDVDDGIVAYLNGTEIARLNAGNPGENFAYNLAATGLREAGPFERFPFSKSLLIAGANVLAVQVHNQSIGSTDVSFRPKLVSARAVVPPQSGSSFPVRFNEIFGRAPAGRWLELYNASGEPADLSGYYLSDQAGALDKHRFPEGTIIPGKGLQSFDEAALGVDLSAAEVFLFLTRPDLQQVVEAVEVENPPAAPQLAGTSDARFPDGSASWWAVDPTRGEPNELEIEDGLVINEIHYNPMAFDPGAGAVPGEFLELYNRGDHAIDLTGFRMTRGVDFQFPDGLHLEPDRYLVVAENPAYIESTYSISGVLGPYQGTLSNGGELIRVTDRRGNTVDEVRYYDGGRWSPWADGGGSSLELRDPRQDNSSPAAWDASDESAKTAWQTVSYTRPYTQQPEPEFQIRMLDGGECLLDSIQVSRGATQYLTNGNFDAATSGWRIEGNHIQSRRETAGAFQGAGCLKVVATGGGDLRVNRIESDTAAITSGNLTVSLAIRWMRGANLILFSGDNHQSPYVHRMPIPADQGSPGRRNGASIANMGPIIADVSHHPPLPALGQTVRIRARAADPDGVASVRAFYRPGSAAGAFTAVTLLDDGAHDDGAAGDGLYAATVPGAATSSRMVFYIEASDGGGAVERFPRRAPQETCVYEHGRLQTSPLHVYRLSLDDAAYQELTTRKLHSNELLPATFVFENEEIYYNVGARYRGSPWNRPGTPKMFRFRFNEDRRFHGWKSFDLGKWGSEQRERLSFYSIWKNSTESVPIPRSRTINTKLFINDSLNGIMEHMEVVDSEYLKFWFPADSDGLIYKIVGRTLFNDAGEMIGNTWAQFQYTGSNKELYRWNWNLQSREMEDQYQPLMTLFQLITSGTVPTLDAELGKILDVEQFFRVMSARTAQEDGDTIGLVNGQNAYIYYAPIEGRFKFIPWDMNLSFNNIDTRLNPDGDPGIARIVGRPPFRRIHMGVYDDMTTSYWTVPELSKFLDPSYQVLGQESAAANPAGMKTFIAGRTPKLRSILPARVPFDIRTNAGADFTTDQVTIKLDGNGWINVGSILVNGVPHPATWIALTLWNINVVLDFGPNVLDVVALDYQGNAIGTDRITVTSTAGWKAPAITSIQPQQGRIGQLATITGTSFHAGIRVFFGSLESPRIIFNEAQNPGVLQAEVAGALGFLEVRVQNSDGRVSGPVPFTILEQTGLFVRGDANSDGSLQIGDAVRILLHLFRGAGLACGDAADADDDETVTIGDAIRVLEYLLLDGPQPPAPFPLPGLDPQGAALDCLDE